MPASGVKTIEFKALFEHTGMGMLILNEKADIIQMNPAAKELLGYTKDERPDLNLAAIKSSFDLTLFEKLRDPLKEETTLTCKDGSHIDVSSVLSRYVDREGNLFYIKTLEDITRQQRQEQELALYKNRYQSIFENSADAMLVMELEGGLVSDCNGAAEKILRASREQIIGLRPDQLSPEFQPDGRSSLESAGEKIGKVISDGYHRFEWVHKRFDNEHFWAEVTVTLSPYEGREVLLVSWRDITEIKAQQTEIFALKERYQKVFDNSADGILIMALEESRIIDCNKAVLEMLRGERADVIGMSARELSPEMQPDGLSSDMAIQRELKEIFEKRHTRFEWLHKRLDGSHFLVEVSVTIDVFDEDEVFYVVWRDITDKKRMEEAFAKQKEREFLSQKAGFDTIFNTTKDGMALLKDNGEFERVNSALVALSGRSEMVFKGKPFSFLSIESEKRQNDALIGQVLQDQYLQNIEMHCESRTGEPFTLNVSLSCIPQSDQIIMVSKDITEEVRMRGDLIKAKHQAQRADQFKSQFLANMSHEIRTPMTAIIGFVDKLAKGEQHGERLRWIETIRHSGETLLSIINDILDFSKIESGKLKLESHPCQIHQVMEESVSIFGTLAKEKGVGLTLQMDARLPECIMCDSVRMKQVLLNQLSNAIKFTSQGGEVTLSVSYDEQHRRMGVEVKDTGIGIAPSNVKKIFSAFEQADISTTRKYGGTGLGLAISSRLVDMMGGKLQVKSVVNEGSTFYFDLPLQICPEYLQGTPNTDEGDIQRFSAHVLVVEDNKTNQLLMQVMLDDLGMTYEIANDGVEGVECFKRENLTLC